MTGRKCGTCKHFEPGPLWRKGWCRNPLLYSPQQSHLVNDEELDCERGMGNYWEAAEPAFSSASGGDISYGFREPVAAVMSSGRPLRSANGQPVYPVTGAAGQGGDRTPYGDPPPGGGWSGGPPNSGDRDYNYDPEERYWTDYLRIAAPILGVILMVLVFWFAISNFLGDDNEDNGELGSADTTPVTLPTVLNTPQAQGTPTTASGTPPPIIVGQQTPGAEGTSAPGSTEPTSPAGDDDPPESSGDIAVGSVVEVFGTGGTGVNVRSEASTEGEIIAVFIDGTILEVTGDPVTAEEFVWWPVMSDEGVQGYVVEEYLALAE